MKLWKETLRTLALTAAAFVALPGIGAMAQTTYTIGTSSCGAGSATWVDCYSLPLTIGTTTTTAWIEMDYQGTAEDFLVFHNGAGDYAISDVQVVSTVTICGYGRCWTLPNEATATLTGTEGTAGGGTLDLKMNYAIGKTGRYTNGPLASSASGTVTVSQ